MMALRNACRSLRRPSSFSPAIIVLAARAEPRLTTNEEADAAGRWDRDTSGPARWDMREKASSSRRKPVKKSMIKTVLMGETVSPRAWKSRCSIIESLIFLASNWIGVPKL